MITKNNALLIGTLLCSFLFSTIKPASITIQIQEKPTSYQLYLNSLSLSERIQLHILSKHYAPLSVALMSGLVGFGLLATVNNPIIETYEAKNCIAAALGCLYISTLSLMAQGLDCLQYAFIEAVDAL